MTMLSLLKFITSIIVIYLVHNIYKKYKRINVPVVVNTNLVKEDIPPPPSTNNDNQLFLKVWRNKYLNSIIWKFVKINCSISYENIGLISAGYNEIYDTRLFIKLNAFQVLKEKVYRNEYINLPIKLKSNFFYYTKEFDQEFWKLFIKNYKPQLQYQRKLFQYIICGNNVNALHVFLNEPFSKCKDKLPLRTIQQLDNGLIELPLYEFPRHKSQLCDLALKVGYLSILKCLFENNEKSISIGQSLFQNILNISGRTDNRVIDKEFKANKQITKIFNYCLENHLFKFQDFSGTIVKIDYLFDVSHSIESLEFIYTIKENVKFDNSRSMNQFLIIDLFKRSFRVVLLYLNFYNYLNSKLHDQRPFIELKYSDFNIDQPELLIKDCIDKSISIPLIQKYIEIAIKDFPSDSKVSCMVSTYLVYCNQFKQAIDLLNRNKLDHKSLFVYGYRFGDIQVIGNENCFDNFNYGLFSNNQNATIQQKIEFINHLLLHYSRLHIPNDVWFSLYETLLLTNQIELIQHLLINDDFFTNSNNTPIYKKIANNKLVLVKGFDSFKLIFKYLDKFATTMLHCLLNHLYDIPIEDCFMVIDWLIQQKNEETGEYYINRRDPEYIDTLRVDIYSDNITKLKYLTENGFACTFKGIYLKVITLKRFNQFKYLFENRKETMDHPSSGELLNDWFQVISYLEQTFGNNSVKEYSKRFPSSSYPIVTPQKLFEYYIVSKQKHKFIQHLDSSLFQLMSNDSGNGNIEDDSEDTEIYSKWEHVCGLIKLASIEFVDDIITVLLNHLSFDDDNNILKLSKFINPLFSSLLNDLNLPAIKFIFNKWPIIIKPEYNKTFDHSSFKIYATKNYSIELFNYFTSIGLPPTEIQEDKPMELTTGFKGLFFFFYCFPNFKFSIPINEEKNSLEIWKINWFFNFYLKNPNSIDENSSSDSDSDSSSKSGNGNGD